MPACTLTPTRHKNIVQMVRDGVPLSRAGPAVGVDKKTAYNWYNRGKEAKSGQLRNFYIAVEKARGQCIHDNITIIKAAAPKNWQAAAWTLERLFPHEYGRLERVEAQEEEAITEVEIIVPELEDEPDGEAEPEPDPDTE